MHTEYSNMAFEVSIETVSKWEKKAHKHSFFELVYIKEGKGKQCINYNIFDYEKNNIFLLPPLDCHSFNIEIPTTFVFLKFSEKLFEQNNAYEINIQNWFDKIAYILRNYNKATGNIIKNQEDNSKIVQLIDLIIAENQKRDQYSTAIIQSMVVGILNLLTRHIEQEVYNIAKPNDSKFSALLKYIQKHLFDNEKLKIPILAERFNISPTYFSEYFKQNYGATLQKYILKSRFKVVETRLLYSDLTIKEIAFEVGFSDSSHLSNIFKRHYKMSIGAFRKRGEYQLLKTSNTTGKCAI
ncbi:AraC family transcriptional regulator [Chondrinema litorale]|uniref:AraC family transcriptional regulator n=1 Tax=Chondrinema litorale TaxID=2994555 RepID=UPI00254292D6|nr:AraC family transcriptional regulator [Chondrinema litorale]UZR97797.1 AraC family transcriptional regulator [Chondrinema litorale]